MEPCSHGPDSRGWEKVWRRTVHPPSFHTSPSLSVRSDSEILCNLETVKRAVKTLPVFKTIVNLVRPVPVMHCGRQLRNTFLRRGVGGEGGKLQFQTRTRNRCSSRTTEAEGFLPAVYKQLGSRVISRKLEAPTGRGGAACLRYPVSQHSNPARKLGDMYTHARTHVSTRTARTNLSRDYQT